MKTVKGKVRAIQSHTTSDPDLLAFRKGDEIINVIKEPDGWWWGTRKDSEELIPKQFPQSFVEDIEELEDTSPFGDIVAHVQGTWKLGKEAKVKPCTDSNLKEHGIKHYICFKYPDGTKRKLGAACSKRKAKEWAELINHVADHDVAGRNEMAAESKYNIATQFSDLIVYCRSMEKKLCPEDYGWNRERVDICLTKSMDELVGARLFRSTATFFVWYHQYALTRVYPRGIKRLNSSNFDPLIFWNCGCQMVALNCQTPDKPMQWNRGKFKQNGGCGYVLKPEFMRMGDNLREGGEANFDPTKLGAEDWGRKETRVTIQVRF